MDDLFLILFFPSITCREVIRVKSQAKMVVLALRNRMPSIQVSPSRGSSTTVAFMACLRERGREGEGREGGEENVSQMLLTW